MVHVLNLALSNEARDELYKNYPHAKLGHLKSGGNFPYLSRSDEVNMHILVCTNLRLSASNSSPRFAKES